MKVLVSKRRSWCGLVAFRSGDICLVGEGLTGEEADVCIMAAFRKVVAGFSLSSRPHSSLAIRAEKSSERDRKIFVRKVWRRVLHDSPGRADLRELMLWSR